MADWIGLDPYEDEKRHSREMRRLKEHKALLDAICDAQYGIPTKCPCGGRIVHEVSKTPKYRRDFDTLPGSRYFTCHQFQDDGLHFRQPWVIGVQEEVEKLQIKVEEQRQTIENMQQQLQSNTTEIAKLKELVEGVRGVFKV